MFHKGQSIFYEGHNPYGIFVLSSGNVRFVSSQKCGTDHVWQSPSGKVLGLKFFFEDRPYCCDCIAKGECEVVFISKTQLEPFRRA
ncbi:MAG: cyclic nucleotide-binding domain-containing protein [Deltaproteobacteria bacterium]|nr:cyclic nucleotide-binding domain-containing protein [Deltaproteobacteria bacterium]